MLQTDEITIDRPALTDNPYQPHMARIVRIYKMVDDNHLFTLRFLDDRLAHTFRHQPGRMPFTGCTRTTWWECAAPMATAIPFRR